ncbi:MAG: lipocalin family protein [Bacteroidales bacterium]|nr:lipocalin family protein [Bacteroidales bacterium]MBO5943052.1 lipocalin family protein [Bacteroidales bacterium]
MKRFLILTALMAVLGLTSCEKEPSKAIVGTWEATTVEMSISGMKMEMDITEMGSKMKITFKDNGTATITETSEEESMSMDFSYSVEGNTLILEAEGDLAEIPITIEKDHMTWTMDGEMLDEPGANIVIHFEKI